jgi:hypothetical protein
MEPVSSTPAVKFDGPEFGRFQRELAQFNRSRLAPTIGSGTERQDVERFLTMERDFVEAARREVRSLTSDVPAEAGKFMDWFENLQRVGPGQDDPLFPWLATQAALDEMKWFLAQEAAGEAGFEDLVALTQVKMPQRAKLEMARNYWDEMGRGRPAAMHGPLLDRLLVHLRITPVLDETCPEALALGNMMMALACSRHYAFMSVGALGAVEMTAPARVREVDRGLKRLGVPLQERSYFALHATLDVKHSLSWNQEVLHSLVEEDGRRAQPIAEGAALRLWCGQRCYVRYREKFNIPAVAPAAGDHRQAVA